MAQDESKPVAGTSLAGDEEHSGHRLGAFLCWAVVFADIGTSVYYTPGILYSQVGRLAGLFVLMTMVVFLLLTLKYSEVSVRFPEGGGVVTVAARGLNPWAGALGGMFILVDYFLTSAISSLSGIQYFTDVIPRIGPYVLPITVVVVTLLGVLNWWGIKESATVSAVIAVAACASDLAILVLVLWKVPFHTILAVFHEIFTGHHLTPPLMLTGFAGAFLAFSGLESISQLSPVMRTPRKKTVNLALAFVVITVGVTSPLLTIFSTTLLDASRVDPNKLISQLGGAYGGEVLKVATAVTASALLVFASNTAIIGAYHVFLALSRMRFFPEVVERRNQFRGTPHVSIALATFIPLGVLLAVRGRIDLLGDMYAFGLLGAFSLTCLALDVIRYRERHGMAHVGALEEAIANASPRESSGTAMATLGSWLSVTAAQYLGEYRIARLRAQLGAAGASAYAAWQRLVASSAPVRALLSRRWPDVKYYLGFVTTFLVCLAWLTNLKAKPLATEFGGGLTLLGVGIAVVHYKYQQRRGESPVHLPMRLLFPIPHAVLVLLPTGDPRNTAVIRAALASASGRPVVFLCLGARPRQPTEMLAFADPYLSDRAAQQILSQARHLSESAKVPAYFVYRVGGAQSVADVWRIVQPDELIATTDVARLYARGIAPEYVRRQVTHDLAIEHQVRRHHVGVSEETSGSEKMPALLPHHPHPAGQHGQVPTRQNGTPPPAPSGPTKGETTPDTTREDWIWTGTDLVRRSPKGKEQPDDGSGDGR